MTTYSQPRNLPKLAKCSLKLRYYTKKHAKEAVKYYKRQHGWTQEYYWCDVHGCYHLSSVES